MKNDLATMERRETIDKITKDNRTRNDELTSERRSRADKTTDENRTRNDELTSERRDVKDWDSNRALTIFLLVLVILVVSAYFIFI